MAAWMLQELEPVLIERGWPEPIDEDTLKRQFLVRRNAAISYAIYLNRPFAHATEGFMRMRPRTKKLPFVEHWPLTFAVLSGMVEFQMGNLKVQVTKGDHIKIQPGTRYSILNSSEQVAILEFFSKSAHRFRRRRWVGDLELASSI